ncbi:MAG: DUF6134 family protein [bacterium]
MIAFVIAFPSTALEANAEPTGVPPSGEIVFNVFMDGDKVGRDYYKFHYTGDTLVVERSVNLSVSYVYINFLDYEHNSTGYWRNGQLFKLDASTRRSDSIRRVKAERRGQEMTILEGDSPARTTDPVIPTSWWNPATTDASLLLDTQFGRFRNVNVTKVGEEQRRKANKTVEADHYRVSGDIELQLWYGPNQELVGIQFERKGYTFTYERIN